MFQAPYADVRHLSAGKGQRFEFAQRARIDRGTCLQTLQLPPQRHGGSVSRCDARGDAARLGEQLRVDVAFNLLQPVPFELACTQMGDEQQRAETCRPAPAKPLEVDRGPRCVLRLQQVDGSTDRPMRREPRQRTALQRVYLQRRAHLTQVLDQRRVTFEIIRRRVNPDPEGRGTRRRQSIAQGLFEHGDRREVGGPIGCNNAGLVAVDPDQQVTRFCGNARRIGVQGSRGDAECREPVEPLLQARSRDYGNGLILAHACAQGEMLQFEILDELIFERIGHALTKLRGWHRRQSQAREQHVAAWDQTDHFATFSEAIDLFPLSRKAV